MTDLKVLLLCGGKGERLRPLTDQMPKPLIKIRNKPILHYLLSQLESFGLKNYIIATGYKAEQFENYFKTSHRNLEIQLVNSGDVDIIQRLKDCRPLLKSDFLLCYGDTLANVNVHDLVKFHNTGKQQITMTTFPLQTQFGIVEMDANCMVTNFVEKPVLDKWINIGYYYCNKTMLENLDKYSNFVDFLRAKVAKQELGAFRHRDVHITVNTLKELDEAQENITEFERNFESKPAEFPWQQSDLTLS